jgi:hypothetical protein
VTAVAGAFGADYPCGMRAAVLLLPGCSLPNSEPSPVEESPSVEDAAVSTPPSLQVEPDAVDFGLVEAGADPRVSIELANVGGGVLLVDELHLADGDPTVELELAGGGQTVAAGTSASLWVTWSPDQTSELNNLILIGSNDPRTPTTVVHLTGQVLPTPHIVVDPTSVDFGQVPVGYTTVQPIAIANVGDADLEIESVSFMPNDPDDMRMKPIDTPLVILPGELVDLFVEYAPTSAGEDHGVITVASNDPVTPQVHAEQSGTCVADPDTGTK